MRHQIWTIDVSCSTTFNPICFLKQFILPFFHPPSIMSPPDNDRHESVVLATQNSESEHPTQHTPAHSSMHVVDLLFNGVVFYVNPFLGAPRIAEVLYQSPPELAQAPEIHSK